MMKVTDRDNNFSISSQNIVRSLTKSVGAAQTFGVSIERLIGMTVAIGETSRESGNILGNSLKTIFSRITTMGGSIEALQSVGVAVKEIKDGVESVRPVSDILDDLGARWSSLNREQQQSIGLQIAGRFQLSRFLILMQNYSTVLSATNTALNSQGSGLRENEQYLKSLEARLNKLKNAGTELALAMGDAFLTDSIIVFAESTTWLVDKISGLIDITGTLPIIFGTVGFAAAALSKNFRATTIAVLTLGNGLKSLGVSAAVAKNAIRGLLASTGVGLVIAGVGFALEKLVGFMGDATDGSNELSSTLEDNIKSTKTNADVIESLVNQYKELAPQAENNVEAQEKLKGIMTELQKIAPELTRDFNSQGDVFSLNTEEALKYVKSLRNISEEQKSILSAKLEGQILDAEEEISKAQKKLDKEQEKFAEYLNTKQEILNAYGVSTVKEFYEAWDNAVQQGGMEGRNMSFDLFGLEDAQKKLEKSKIDEKLNSLNEAIGKHDSLVIRKNALDGINDSNERVGDSTSALIPIFDEAENSLGFVANEAELVAGGFELINTETELLEDGTERVISFIVKSKNSMSELNEQVSKTVSSINTLGSAYQTLASGEQLSLDTLVKLISEYPELARHLATTNDLTFNKGELVKWVAERERDRLVLEKQNALDSIDATRRELQTKKNMYEIYYGAMLNGVPHPAMFSEEDEAALDLANKQYSDLQATINALNSLDFTKTFSPKSSSSSKDFDIFVVDEYNRALKDIEVAFAVLNSTKARTKEDSAEYTNLLNKEIDLLKQQQSITSKEADRLRAVNSSLETRRSKLSKTSEEYQKLSKEIYDNEISIKSLQVSWRGFEQSIININKSIADLDLKRLDELADKQKEWSDSVKSSTKDAMGIIEDYYSEQEKLAKQSLDKQLDEFNDFIDDQLKALDRLDNTQDYNKELSKKQKEQSKIQQQINEISLDDSIEAQAKRRELEEELAKIIEEIDEFQLDRQRELRRDNFNDLKDIKKKEVDAQKKSVEESWKDALATDKTYLSLRENLLNNNVAALQSTLESFSANISSYMITVGDSIQQNTIDKIIAAKNEIDKIKNLQTTISTNSQVSDEQQKVFQMMTNSGQWKNADPETRKRLEEANQALGKSIGATYKASEGRWFKNGIPLYHQGGVAKNGSSGSRSPISEKLHQLLNLKSDEFAAILRNNELIVKDPPSAMVNIQNMMRNFNPPVTSKTNNQTQVPNVFKFDRLINIENVSDKSHVNYMMNELDLFFKGKGFIM